MLDPKVRVSKILSSDTSLGQSTPIHTHTELLYYPNIIFSSTVASSKWPCSFKFSSKTSYAFLISSMHAVFLTKLVLLDFITLGIFGEKNYEDLRFPSLLPLSHVQICFMLVQGTVGRKDVL